MTPQPFTVAVPQAVLDDLGDRLARTRWTDEPAGAGWDYGASVAYLRELVGYWATDFDWRAQEAALNRLAHFRAEVDGVGIHFVHERGQGPDPLPLVLLHGWPSTFQQMLKILPLLTDPAAHGGDPADAFDVVVPSLPGYGFSDRPDTTGVGVAQIGELFAKLLTDGLGYGRFAIRASDLGAGVSKELALAHPDLLVGLHHSGTSPFVFGVPGDLSEAEQAFLAEAQQFAMLEGAYAMLQSSKPQTPAVGLNDSPAGLAAWLVEKFRAWSDCGGDVERRYTKDELLAYLTVYWVTETIGSSMRLYAETARVPSPNAGKKVETPTAMAMLPKDLVHGPREWHEREYNVQRWTELPRGGHFGEWEEPQLLAEDIRAFFRPLR
jgi:pimeloyl-ACP methyl ester carboxylesterase